MVQLLLLPAIIKLPFGYQSFSNWCRCASGSIDCIQLPNEELDEIVHLDLVFDYQEDLSIYELKGYALPDEERCLTIGSYDGILGYEMFS